jgi:4a-hydroxytetrahydrobiopterin dehydratase
MTKLTSEELEQELSELDGWSIEGDNLTKTLKFPTFPGGIAFVNQTAELAEDMGHHPDINIRYSTITLYLSTHDEGGITAKDIALARRIDALSRH